MRARSRQWCHRWCTLDEDDYVKINGVVFTGFTVQQDDADESLINAFELITGVLASRNDDGQIVLVLLMDVTST